MAATSKQPGCVPTETGTISWLQPRNCGIICLCGLAACTPEPTAVGVFPEYLERRQQTACSGAVALFDILYLGLGGGLITNCTYEKTLAMADPGSAQSFKDSCLAASASRTSLTIRTGIEFCMASNHFTMPILEWLLGTCALDSNLSRFGEMAE